MNVMQRKRNLKYEASNVINVDDTTLRRNICIVYINKLNIIKQGKAKRT